MQIYILKTTGFSLTKIKLQCFRIQLQLFCNFELENLPLSYPITINKNRLKLFQKILIYKIGLIRSDSKNPYTLLFLTYNVFFTKIEF